MKTAKNSLSRRKFIGKSTIAAVGATLISPSLFSAPAILKHNKKPNSIINGVQIGVITYSFRSMEDQSAEAILKYVLNSGINAIELIGDPAETFVGRPNNPIDMAKMWPLREKRRDGKITEEEEKELVEMTAQLESYKKQVSKWRATSDMSKFEQFRKMYNDAGVNIYAFKPRNTFGMDNSDADIEWGMKVGKILGANHVTVEHPSDDSHTMRLGALGKKNGMYIGYHGHEQQTPILWDTALAQSEYNALNLDLGHYTAAGNSKPLEIIIAKHDRIKSMHLKDRQTPENDKGNLSWGQGDTPIAQALQLMQRKKYNYPATVELEYKIPEGSNAVEEVKKCLNFCEQALK
jgi:sugar phosphate isomerase/epimerase